MAKLYFKVGSNWEEVVRLRNEIVKLKQELKSMDSTQSPAAFKTLNTQLAASTQRMDELVTNAAKAGAVMEGDFKKKIFTASQSVNGFTEKIIAQKAVVKDVEADVKRLGEAYRSALKNNPLSANSKLSEYTSAKKVLDEEKAALFGLTQEQANARLSVKKLRDEYALYQNDGKQVVETNNGIAISWKKALAVIGGTAAIKKFISDLVNVRGEFQKTQMSFETMLGSKEKADKLMAQMVETSAKTPFDLQGVANGAKQLLAYGTEAENVNDTLIRLGNIASGLSIPLGDMVYLYGTTQTQGRLFTQDVRQFMGRGVPLVKELAAMLGKTEEEINKMVTAGQIGFSQVEAVIKKMTDEGGKFYNLMQKQSETLSGQISNLGDAWDRMLNSIGEDTQGLTSKTISMTTSAVENYESVGKILVGLITTYGAYRTAVMLVTAAESKHTLVEIGLTNVRILARKAQLALNASMLTNPYVALVVAVGGLVTAMWAMSDSATVAARAQKEYNEIKDIASKKEQEHKQKIDELISSARDESLATLTRQKSLEALREEYPKIFEQYDLEKLKLDDILKIKRQINEEDSTRTANGKREDYTSLKQTVANQQRFLQLNDNPDQRKNMSDKDLSIWKMFAGKQSYVQVREDMQKNAEMLKLLQKDIIADNIASYKVELKSYSKEKLEAELKMAQSEASKRNGFNVGGFMIKGGDLENVVSSINATLSKKKSPTTYQEDLAKAKEDWLSAKKGYEALLKDQKATSAEVKEAKNSLASKEKTYKDLGGDVGEEKNATKQESAINIQNEKIADLERKQMLDRQRQQEDLEVQLAQSRIDTMKNGYEKEQAQRELNNKKEIQTLQRQKEDYIHAYTQMQKEIFDAQEDLKVKQDSKYKKKTFDSSSVTVDTSMFDTIIDNTNQKQTQEQSEYYKDLLSQYQSYTEKRLAIQEKFQKDREGLVRAGASEDVLGEHDYQREEALKSIDNEFAMREDSFKAWADSITDLSLEKLRELLTQAEQELQRSETLNPNNPQLAVQRAKVSSLKNTVSEKSERAKTSPDKRSLKDWQDLRKTLSEVGKEFDEIGKTVGGTAGEIISAAGGIASATLQMIDGIVTLANGSAQAMSGTAQAASTAIQTVEKASVILAIIGAALQIATKIANMFGADYSEYNKAKENYEDYVKVLDTVISKQKELIDTMTGKAAVEASMKALELIEKQADAARILGKERLNAGASAGSHSIGVRINKGMFSEGWNEAKAALGSDFFSKRIDDGRMTGLFDLSVEQLEKLQMEAPTFWAKLDGDVRDYLEQIIACNEKTGEMKDLLNESLTGISFDSLFDNFLESLYDMESSAEDISDDMADYLRKSLIKSFAVENYKGQMKEWYEKWADAMKDGEITSEEQKSLDDLKNSIITGATESAKLINDQFEYLKNDTSQSSSRGGFQTMDQDTGEELNGRFTALQMAGEEIKVQNVSQSESLNILTVKADAILSVNTDTRNIADEIRTIQVNSYLELQEIRQNTGDTVKQLKAMDEKLKNIENNTKNI